MFPEHIGCIVPDLAGAVDELKALGHQLSAVAKPVARIRSGGITEETALQYVVTSGALPRIKLIEEVPGTFWVRGGTNTLHHVTYWVNDLEEETVRHLEQGGMIEADGLNEDGSLRYRYLRLRSGLRVELGQVRLRAEFEDWAS